MILIFHSSTTPTCFGSTPSTRPRRPASPVLNVAPALPTPASPPRLSLSSPMRKFSQNPSQDFKALTMQQQGCVVQHPLRSCRLDLQRLSWRSSRQTDALPPWNGAQSKADPGVVFSSCWQPFLGICIVWPIVQVEILIPRSSHSVIVKVLKQKTCLK
jgi:hypothetical protein